MARSGGGVAAVLRLAIAASKATIATQPIGVHVRLIVMRWPCLSLPSQRFASHDVRATGTAGVYCASVSYTGSRRPVHRAAHRTMSLSRLPLSYCTNVHPGRSVAEVE